MAPVIRIEPMQVSSKSEIYEEEIHGMWKKGQAMWEYYRSIVRVFGNAIKKAKVPLELNLERTTRASADISATKGRLGKV